MATEPPNSTTGSCFEGPEKTLRVVFENVNLLKFSAADWQRVLDKVKCKILSVAKTSTVHTYLLSESSLIVYESSLILKTCGTTQLIDGLPLIKQLVDAEFKAVFYTRRSYFFPLQQTKPQGCWNLEIEHLKTVLKNDKSITTRTFGKDCLKWHYFEYLASTRISVPPFIELMMSELDSSACTRFSCFGNSKISTESEEKLKGVEMTKDCEIDRIFSHSNQLIDSYAFNPCGYSCNAIIESSYFTIHVTPETGCTYASFETNACAEPVQQALERVLQIFKPGSVMVVGINTAVPEMKNYTYRMGGIFASECINLTHCVLDSKPSPPAQLPNLSPSH